MKLFRKQVVSAVRRQGGFSMIEVLVTLLIISLALLGTAGLQAYSMRLNQGSQFRTQAVFLVADLAERMEANRLAAIAGTYVTPTSNVPAAENDTCAVGVCTADQLAAYDLAQWQNAIANTLPQSEWTVQQTTAGNPSTYTIRISWVDRIVDTSQTFDAGSDLGVNAAGTGERFFYTATRTIFD